VAHQWVWKGPPTERKFAGTEPPRAAHVTATTFASADDTSRVAAHVIAGGHVTVFDIVAHTAVPLSACTSSDSDAVRRACCILATR
jgi:hypothetical protein